MKSYMSTSSSRKSKLSFNRPVAILYYHLRPVEPELLLLLLEPPEPPELPLEPLQPGRRVQLLREPTQPRRARPGEEEAD